MAIAGAISYSANTKSHKNIKSWREVVKYLPRVYKVGVFRRMGFVLTLDKVVLRCVMDGKYAG